MAKRSLDFNQQPATPKKIPKNTDDPIPLSPGEITEPNPNVTVNGVVACLSPLRASKYFDSELTDGDTVIRFVGFRNEQRRMLSNFCDQKTPITLTNCQIQLNKFNNQLEILLKNSTQMELSTAEFSIPDIKTVGSLEIKLKELSDQDEYAKVTIKAKVIKANEPQKVGTGKIKQDVTIADSTATAMVTLWESDVHMLIQNKCYQMNKLIVRSFLGKYYLSVPSTGATIEEIDDLVDIVSDPEPSSDDDDILTAVTVDGVQQLESVYSCINCKKSISATTDSLVVCEVCQTTQKITKQRYTAKLFIQLGQQRLSLRAYDEALKQIAQTDGSIKCEDLLFAPPFDLSYNKYHVITDVSRT